MYNSTLSLTSALAGVGGQRHSPAALAPGKRPGTHCIGGWVGPRANLDGCGKSRPPTGIRSPDGPARSESLYRLSYPGPQLKFPKKCPVSVPPAGCRTVNGTNCGQDVSSSNSGRRNTDCLEDHRGCHLSCKTMSVNCSMWPAIMNFKSHRYAVCQRHEISHKIHNFQCA